jgi:hypothetical protein
MNCPLLMPVLRWNKEKWAIVIVVKTYTVKPALVTTSIKLQSNLL